MNTTFLFLFILFPLCVGRPQTLTLTVDGQEVKVNYPTGLDASGLAGIADEIITKLDLRSG